MPRKIIHIDLDAFFCAVEEKKNPALKGLAFAVGGKPDERGVVSSCSYAARAYGVRSAISMHRALSLCPKLIVIPPSFKDYASFSLKVMEWLRAISPLIEQISIDEAFLDVTDLPESGISIAQYMQNYIKEDIGLPCSIGVATNKLVAKIATDKGKQYHTGSEPPNAITVVPPGTESEFLAPLPVQNLWGIGPKTADRLEKMGIKTIGNLASTPPQHLVSVFGKFNHEMIERARGIDRRPVILTHDTKSISQETTFTHDISSLQTLKHTIISLSEAVGARLREEKLYARTIKLKLRWANFTTISRQITLSNPTDIDREIHETATLLLEKAWKNNQSVRLIGVGVTNLGMPTRQLNFWENSIPKKDHKLQITVDEIRKKYGRKILRFGNPMESHDE